MNFFVKKEIFLESLLYSAMVGFFISLNFQTINHQFIYISTELLALYGFFKFHINELKKYSFIKYYTLIILWCIIVTLHSPVIKDSFKGLTHWILPIFLCFGLCAVGNLKDYIVRLIWIPTCLAFILSIILFRFWHNGIDSVQNNTIYNFLYFLNDEWPGKVYTSTINLCLIIFILKFIRNKTYKYSLFIINFVSGALTYDRAFYFSFVLIFLLYFFLERYRITRKLFITSSVSIFSIVVLLAVVLHLFGIDLHYQQRFAVYTYWLPKLLLFPITGVGVELKSLQYIVINYPVPDDLLFIDRGMLYHSHNVFVDIALTQGFIGLMFFLIMLYKMNKEVIQLGGQYRFVTLYMCVAIFSKFMVDDRFDGHNMIVFWFFILSSYIIGKKLIK